VTTAPTCGRVHLLHTKENQQIREISPTRRQPVGEYAKEKRNCWLSGYRASNRSPAVRNAMGAENVVRRAQSTLCEGRSECCVKGVVNAG
jgi:hypothetical protein